MAWLRATGAGRIFEAAGALLGLCTVNRHEGEAAMAFEALAERHEGDVDCWSEIELPPDREG